MKFNWGHGIFIFLTVFILSVVFLVYKGFQQDNALVEKEYYPKGLEYQKQIDRISNAEALPEKIRLMEEKGMVVIIYPVEFKGKNPVGSIYFYRPSNETGDLTEKIRCDSTLHQFVPLEKLLRGKYIVKMSWKMENKEYYQEEVLFIKQ